MNEKQSKILMVVSIIITVLAVVCLIVFYKYSFARLLALFVGVIAIDIFFVNKRKLDYRKKMQEREQANKLNGVDEENSQNSLPTESNNEDVNTASNDDTKEN